MANIIRKNERTEWDPLRRMREMLDWDPFAEMLPRMGAG